jgi:hypothetical protein
MSNFASKLSSHRYSQRNIHLSNIIIFTISINNKCNICQLQKKFSVDIPLLSYSFLIRLINRIFNLHSNFILKTKYNIIIKDDFDLDGCIMNEINENNLEFIINQYDIDDWYIIEDNLNDNFNLIEIENNCILVTIKTIYHRQETLLQKATSWFHGSVLNNYLTRKEFIHMLDLSNGRLLNEEAFRQRIYDTGCDQSIRKIVWCYLFRIFNQTMTNEDKIQYIIKAKERYHE